MSNPKMPAGLVNLSERYPQYEPGVDARDIKKNFGKKGAIIHGHLLGELNMPATIADPVTGEYRPWTAICVELLAPCTGKVQDPENPDRVEVKSVPKGGRIIITKTTAIESLYERGLAAALADHDNVYEIYVEPQVGKTKGGQSLWLYPSFGIGKPMKRTESQHVAIRGASSAPQVGASNGQAQGPGAAGARPAYSDRAQA